MAEIPRQTQAVLDDLKNTNLALEAGGNLETMNGYLSLSHDDLLDIYNATLINPQHAYRTSSLTSAYSAGIFAALIGDGAVAITSDRSHLDFLALTVSALTGAAASVTYYLSHDAAGIMPITSPVTITLAGLESITAGSYLYVDSLDVPYQRTGGSGPFITAKVNADTATLVARLYHHTQHQS